MDFDICLAPERLFFTCLPVLSLLPDMQVICKTYLVQCASRRDVKRERATLEDFLEDPQVFTLHVISNCPEGDLQCFPSNEGNSFMSRKAVSEGDHSQKLQRSQEDKNLKCFWIWPYPPSFPSRSNPNSASSHPPAGQRRPLPSLLCKAWAGSSLKSLFSGTEGRRALSMEGKLMLILCTAVGQN